MTRSRLHGMCAKVLPVEHMSRTVTPVSKNPKAVAEQVAAILRDRIIKGQLAPRDRIVERQLSAELDVSRTPIREALKLLEVDGLIDITLHRGAVVCDYRPEDAVALFDVIAVLEGLAARRFCAAVTEETLQKIEDLHRDMLEHHAAGRMGAYFDVNSVIHDAIVAGSGNPELQATHEKLMIRARRGRFLAIMKAERLAEAVAEHEILMRCLHARDAEGAAQIWETHLRHTGETLADVLGQSGDS